jgi:hypothetical protein
MRPVPEQRRALAWRRTAVTATLLAAACLGLSACGSARSVAAVCSVWDTEGLALHERYERDAKGVNSFAGMFTDLASVLGAPNELAHMMSRMADVAPTEVEPDFESVAGAFKKLSESESAAITDPLAAVGGNLVEALASEGSFNRVNSFISSNCGIPNSK